LGYLCNLFYPKAGICHAFSTWRLRIWLWPLWKFWIPQDLSPLQPTLGLNTDRCIKQGVYFNYLNISLCSVHFNNLTRIGHPVGYFVFTLVFALRSAIMDNSINTPEQNKHILSTSFRNWKKKTSFLLIAKPSSPPFQMLKYPPRTLSRGYHIEKLGGVRNVRIANWKSRVFNKTGIFCRGSVLTTFVHNVVGNQILSHALFHDYHIYIVTIFFCDYVSKKWCSRDILAIKGQYIHIQLFSCKAWLLIKLSVVTCFDYALIGVCEVPVVWLVVYWNVRIEH